MAIQKGFASLTIDSQSEEIAQLTSLAHRMLQALEITCPAYEEIEIDDVMVPSFDFLKECRFALKEHKL